MTKPLFDLSWPFFLPKGDDCMEFCWFFNINDSGLLGGEIRMGVEALGWRYCIMGELEGDLAVIAVVVALGVVDVEFKEGSNLREILPRERSSNNVMILPWSPTL